jgi:hypothetical protein
MQPIDRDQKLLSVDARGRVRVSVRMPGNTDLSRAAPSSEYPALKS